MIPDKINNLCFDLDKLKFLLLAFSIFIHNNCSSQIVDTVKPIYEYLFNVVYQQYDNLDTLTDTETGIRYIRTPNGKYEYPDSLQVTDLFYYELFRATHYVSDTISVDTLELYLQPRKMYSFENRELVDVPDNYENIEYSYTLRAMKEPVLRTLKNDSADIIRIYSYNVDKNFQVMFSLKKENDIITVKKYYNSNLWLYNFYENYSVDSANISVDTYRRTIKLLRKMGYWKINIKSYISPQEVIIETKIGNVYLSLMTDYWVLRDNRDKKYFLKIGKLLNRSFN